ncbi:DMT family transporter [Marinobacterium arenosum]|uniref:DMT family transporter n=1 Tax=Marinobacterium arenosum TaxID=2862496 RepID=UPI001C98B380|nr:DMT family transporter [Marinobacterium arenosum]MBY4677467.1 DMT family transporter [Marinobacterium arenosum]
MNSADLRDLILLAALWGGSFLFMRVAVPAFGAIPLIELRVLFATLVLLPLLLRSGQLAGLRSYARPMLVVGLINSALPFCLFAYAMLDLTSGVTAIINATAPLFGALIASLLRVERLTAARCCGLFLGFAGVVGLIASQGRLNFDGGGLPVLAALGGAMCYGIAANYSSRKLAGVAPLVIAAGSQLAATALLLPLALYSWPTVLPSAGDWASVLVLGVACTGFAYLLYFRLINNLGATGGVSVTFLIPAFAMGWGALLIDEPITPAMLACCGLILLGTALSIGILRPGFLRLRRTVEPSLRQQ